MGGLWPVASETTYPCGWIQDSARSGYPNGVLIRPPPRGYA
jgi:hypothetical protein